VIVKPLFHEAEVANTLVREGEVRSELSRNVFENCYQIGFFAPFFALNSSFLYLFGKYTHIFFW
jgi:hypothetical protein